MMSHWEAFSVGYNAAALSAVFLAGIFTGSFLNVCIYRLPRNLPVIFARSRCPSCRKILGWLDLLPAVGYFLRRGRCHYCENPISGRYPLVEFLSAFLFLWCYMEYHFSLHFFKAALLASFLIVIAFIDIDRQLIYDKVLVWFGGLGVLVNICGNYNALADFLLAGAIGGGFLYLIILATGGAMGLGDAKLAFAVGLWLGVKLTVLALFLAFFTGAVAGLALILTGRKSRKDFMPFAPFIAIGTFLSVLYGDRIIDWYLTLLDF